MDNGKSLLKLLISGVVISLIISIATIQILKLDNPVFIQHYKEIGLVENEDGNIFDGSQVIQLPYIVDNSEKREIVDIEFEEYPELSFSISDYYNPHYIDSKLLGGANNINSEGISYGGYIMKYKYLTFHSINFSSSYEFEDIVLSEAKIIFDNGDRVDIDLGQIVIYEEELEYRDFLEWLNSGSSSDGTALYTAKVLKDFEIVSSDSKLDIDDDIYNLNIDKYGIPDENDVVYKENDYMYIQTAFNNTKNIVEEYSLYDIAPRIVMKDNDGNLYYHTAMIGNYSINFDGIDIYKYLRAREAI